MGHHPIFCSVSIFSIRLDTAMCRVACRSRWLIATKYVNRWMIVSVRKHKYASVRYLTMFILYNCRVALDGAGCSSCNENVQVNMDGRRNICCAAWLWQSMGATVNRLSVDPVNMIKHIRVNSQVSGVVGFLRLRSIDCVSLVSSLSLFHCSCSSLSSLTSCGHLFSLLCTVVNKIVTSGRWCIRPFFVRAVYVSSLLNLWSLSLSV